MTLAPGPEGLWAKISGELVTLPDLRVVAWVDMTPYLDGEEVQDTRGFADAARSAVSNPQTISSRPERSKRVTHHRIFALAALPGCIDPKIVEDALHKHPAVALAAAIGRPDAYAGEIPVIYVQSQPGAVVSEQELLEFAARTGTRGYSEARSPSLPMTAVGKIFKPALQQLELEMVIRSEASRVGATIKELSVERHEKGGIGAKVRVIGDARALRNALDRYAFKSEFL